MGRRFSSLADVEFNRLFTDFKFTAYRLEALQRYDVTYEQDEFSRFLAGEARGEFPGIAEWIDGTVTKAVAAGKSLSRVHVVELPMSDYVRFECAWAYEHTVEAGEDVRILPVRRGSGRRSCRTTTTGSSTPRNWSRCTTRRTEASRPPRSSTIHDEWSRPTTGATWPRRPPFPTGSSPVPTRTGCVSLPERTARVVEA